MSEHAKEPWDYEEIRRDEVVDYAIIDAEGKRICDTLGSEFGYDRTQIASAKRIKACVNALEGIKNPEAVKDLVDIARRFDRDINTTFGSAKEAIFALNELGKATKKALAKLEGKS